MPQLGTSFISEPRASWLLTEQTAAKVSMCHMTLTRKVGMFTKTQALGMKMPATAYPAPPCSTVVKGSPLRVSEQQSCQNPINPQILWSPTFPSLNHHCLEHWATLATVIHTILKLWVGGGGIKVELWELMAHTHIMRCTQKKKVTTAEAEIKLPLKSQDIRIEISQIMTITALYQCAGTTRILVYN